MKKVLCPICEKAMPGSYSEWPDYPFCSPRCRKIDLGRWLGEEYRFPGAGRGDADSEESSTPDDDES